MPEAHAVGLHHPVDGRPARIARTQTVPEIFGRSDNQRRVPVIVERAQPQQVRPVPVQLDAPRHLVLYTPHALKQVAERCGLEMCGMYYDSWAFQFWGSEQYRRDIPLEDLRSVSRDRPLGSFTQQEMDEFTRRSEEANQNQDGDQAVFFFKSTGLAKIR